MQTKKEEKRRADIRKIFIRIVAGVCALLIAGSVVAVAFAI